MPLDIQALPSDSINTKWKEPYASASLNKRPVGITPPGIYRGLTLGEDPLSGDRTVVVIEDPDKGDHVAVFETEEGYSVNYRDPDSGQITLSLAAYDNTVVVIALFINYSIGVTTEGFFRTFTQSEYNALPQATRDSLVVLGTVTVPDTGGLGGPIPSGNIALTGRTLASSNLQRGLVQNPPITRNPSFEIGEAGQTHLRSSRYWEKSVSLGTGAWTTASGFADHGTKSIQFSISSGPITASLKQYAGIEVTEGEIITANVSLFQQNTVSSGDFEFFVEFSDSDGALLSTLFTDLDGGSVDADWRIVNPIFAVPVGASAIRSFGVRAVSLNPTSNGVFASIDSVEVFIEPSNPTLPYAFDQRFRQWLSAIGVQLSEEEAQFGDQMAAITFDESTPASEGSVKVDTNVPGNLPPALAILGRMYNLGSGLLSSAVNAQKARVSAGQAAPAQSLYTLMWESRRGVNQAFRLYVKEDGTLALTVNARWDTQWNKDDGGNGACMLAIEDGGVLVKTTDSGTATWGDGSWTQGTLTTDFVSSLLSISGQDVAIDQTLTVDGDVEGKQRLTIGEDMTLSDVDAETAKITVNSAPLATSQRTLIFESLGPSGSQKIRMFVAGNDTDCFEITSNAYWDDSLGANGQWVLDTTNNAVLYRFARNDLWVYGTSNNGPFDDGVGPTEWNYGTLRYDISTAALYLGDAAISNQTDAELYLSDGRIYWRDIGTSTNPPMTNDYTNLLCQLNTVKCWGFVQGGIPSTLVDGFNVDSISNNAGNVQVNVGAAFDDEDYAVICDGSRQAATGSGRTVNYVVIQGSQWSDEFAPSFGFVIFARKT